jgi:hypothetical protein
LLQAAIVVTLASLVLPQIAEPPFSYVASFFLVTPWYMVVFFFIFVVLLRGVEEEVGETNYFVVYFVGVLLGNLGFLTLKSPGAVASVPLAFVGGGAMGGLLALAGVFIARHPYDLFAFRLYYPLPAILCLVAMVFLEILTPDLRLDYLPLLFGVAVCYGLRRAEQQRAQSPAYYSR